MKAVSFSVTVSPQTLHPVIQFQRLPSVIHILTKTLMQILSLKLKIYWTSLFSSLHSSSCTHPSLPSSAIATNQSTASPAFLGLPFRLLDCSESAHWLPVRLGRKLLLSYASHQLQLHSKQLLKTCLTTLSSDRGLSN